jgi:hypothetical protein
MSDNEEGNAGGYAKRDIVVSHLLTAFSRGFFLEMYLLKTSGDTERRHSAGFFLLVNFSKYLRMSSRLDMNLLKSRQYPFDVAQRVPKNLLCNSQSGVANIWAFPLAFVPKQHVCVHSN